MRYYDVGMDADFGRPDDDDCLRSPDCAMEDALSQFWDRCAEDAEDFFGDDVEAEIDGDGETVNIYRKHDHKLLSQEDVSPYAVPDEQEWEYD